MEPVGETVGVGRESTVIAGEVGDGGAEAPGERGAARYGRLSPDASPPAATTRGLPHREDVDRRRVFGHDRD